MCEGAHRTTTSVSKTTGCVREESLQANKEITVQRKRGEWEQSDRRVRYGKKERFYFLLDESVSKSQLGRCSLGNKSLTRLICKAHHLQISLFLNPSMDKFSFLTLLSLCV